MSNMAKPKRWASASEHSGDQGQTPNVVPIRVDGGDDPLGSFTPESGTTAPGPPRVVRVEATLIVAFAALVATAAVAAGVFFFRGRIVAQPARAITLTGRAVLNSRPGGAAVLIDGVSRGVTPLELELPAGSHGVVFRSGASERRIDLKVDANTRVSENVDMPVVVSSTGVLEITSDPSGARVSMDGSSVGVTPLTLKNIAAARHTLVITHGSNSVNRAVEVASGATASIFVALGQSASSNGGTGTFAVESPLELRIVENGQLLGVSNAAPIVVSAGKHQFDLVNELLEVHLTRSVSVDPGKSTRLSVTVPSGTLSVNALPWAEVFVDGRSIGVTPLGSVAVPIGSHEVVWRHPQLGEKRRTVVVGAQTPARVSMDLSK
jgi:PEGA domain-containing protein